MRTSQEFGLWLSSLIVVLALAAGSPAQADSTPSDTFGVRANSNPNSPKPNVREFNGSIVLDQSIRETSDGFDLNSAGGTPLNVTQFDVFAVDFPCAAKPNQACLNNHAIVNLGVTGYAYLLEGNTSTASDRISIVFNPSKVSGSNLVQVTITLDSDPFSSPITPNPLTSIPEKPGFIDVSDQIFDNVLANAFSATNSVGIPFHVKLESDADVPEPGTWAMLLVGLGAMGVMMRARQRKQASAAKAV